MILIDIKVAGDAWFNSSEVVEKLTNINNLDHCKIVLSLAAEGPSLHRLGVVDTILKLGIDPANVSVINWPNNVEEIPFESEQHRASHFFWQPNLHNITRKFGNKTDCTFGLFLGRRTISRCRILYDLYQQHRSRSFFSLMQDFSPLPWHNTNSEAVYVESIADWTSDIKYNHFVQWWDSVPIVSVDSKKISDQYDADQDTNRSLLAYYDRFDIEIVCETYCYGSTFFPTEKTVRPISAEKPFLCFGPRGYLKHLRSLGFETFDSIWDETYDAYEGTQRWNRMKQQLLTISQLGNSDRNRLKDIAEHNKNNLIAIVNRYGPK